jgi:subtilisin family serine protease
MIDTNIDPAHPSLNGHDIYTQSFLTEETPTASAEHGTAVATLLFGTSGPSKTGLLPKAKLSVAETFRELQPGQVESTTWNIVRGLDWLVKQNVQVINLSLGGPPNGLLTYAINRTLKHNIPIVAAAGNTGPHGRSMYPAAQEGVIAVTALDASLHSYHYASRGDFIAFSAPGVDIWVPTGEEQGVFRSGTSFAAPFVTMAVAVMKSSHPEWSSEQIAQDLATHSKDLGAEGKDSIFGWGLIQFPKTCSKPSPSPHPQS